MNTRWVSTEGTHLEGQSALSAPFKFLSSHLERISILFAFTDDFDLSN